MITEPATYEGQGGRAWQAPETDSLCALGGFLLYAPKAHPLWSWHTLSLISLADFPGYRPAKRFDPCMTHELLVEAIDPKREPTTVAGPHTVMRPPDVLLQFSTPPRGGWGQPDEFARYVLQSVAQGVARGTLPPDSDFERLWKATVQQLGAELVLRSPGFDAPIPKP